jgi:hypothetical protein
VHVLRLFQHPVETWDFTVKFSYGKFGWIVLRLIFFPVSLGLFVLLWVFLLLCVVIGLGLYCLWELGTLLASCLAVWLLP